MDYQKVSDPEKTIEQYDNNTQPLTDSIKPTKEKEESITDDIPEHLEAYLQTKPTFGLTDDQVLERRDRFGPNELTEKKRNKLLHFLSFCKQ